MPVYATFRLAQDHGDRLNARTTGICKTPHERRQAGHGDEQGASSIRSKGMRFAGAVMLPGTGDVPIDVALGLPADCSSFSGKFLLLRAGTGSHLGKHHDRHLDASGRGTVGAGYRTDRTDPAATTRYSTDPASTAP